jgi:hypothetical protein
MKTTSITSSLSKLLAIAAAIVIAAAGLNTSVLASGGSSGGGGSTTKVDSIKVNKCEYAWTGGYCELLVQAVSSNSAAHLYAYLPDGTYLGEVQNGGGGRYGGTVFGSFYIPLSITILSTGGGAITAPCVPFQP